MVRDRLIIVAVAAAYSLDSPAIEERGYFDDYFLERECETSRPVKLKKLGVEVPNDCIRAIIGMRGTGRALAQVTDDFAREFAADLQHSSVLQSLLI